jgi:Hypothetical protein (DUF2513)
MKRDMDLIRTILLKLEADSKLDGTQHRAVVNLGIADCTNEEVNYHAAMLVDAGYLVGNTKRMDVVLISKLTWQGHDFLDSIRDPKIWARTKEGVEGAGGFTVDLLKDLAKGLVKKQIEEYTGVKL